MLRRGLALLATLSTAAWANEVIVLRPAPPGGLLDEARLAEAVRIQTRDLGVEGAADAAGRRVRLTLWHEEALAPDGSVAVTLFALEPGADSPSLLRVRGTLGDDLYRALALKVRALLTGPAPSPPAAKPAARLLGDVEVGYQAMVTAPLGSTRQGVALAAFLTLRAPFEIGIATSIDTRSTSDGTAGRAAATVVPIWAVARFVGRRGRLGGGVGVRAGLAVIAADGTATDGAHGSATTAVAIVGFDLVGRVHLSPHFALYAAAGADALVPHPTFTVDGRPALDPGGLALRLGAGLAVAWP